MMHNIHVVTVQHWINKTKMLNDITTDGTNIFMQSDDSLKQKIIFVVGFLTHKYHSQ